MTEIPADRAALMLQHVAARGRRDAAPLDSADYRAASEEVANIEIAIARAEEPPIVLPGTPSTSSEEPTTR